MNLMATEFLQHELSAAFPAMPANELAALTEDVRVNGQREPGVVFEGKVLDGWHRYQACAAAGLRFAFAELPTDADPVAFVKSRNFHRRHMTESQRAGSMVKCSAWRSRGKCAPGAHLPSAKEMAREADVSVRTIVHAKAADSAGLGNAVIEGRVSAKRAAEIATASPKLAKQIAAGGEIPKIVPRRETANTEAKPEVDPLDTAREYAKKQQAVIRKLRKDVAERDATIESLNGQLQESRDNARELAESLEAHIKSGEGDAKVAKELKRLAEMVRTLESQRDQYMQKANETVKQVRALERAAGKQK